LSFTLKNIIFRPTIKKYKATQRREQIRKNHELMSRRRHLLEELGEVNDQLGMEQGAGLLHDFKMVFALFLRHNKECVLIIAQPCCITMASS